MVKLIGVALIVLGVIALVYQGITYTRKQKIIDVGPFKAEVKREKTIPLSPALDVGAVAGGIALLIFGGAAPRSARPAQTASLLAASRAATL